MNERIVAKLRDIVDDRFFTDYSLAKFSHYKIGGAAKYFVEVLTTEEVVEVMSVVREFGLDFVVIGGGTNILVGDSGFDGLVIRMANRSVQIDEESGKVVAEAGVLSSSLARQVSRAGLTGLEWAIGLPGTIGGAVTGNSGCFGGETKDRLVRVEVLDVESGEVVEVPVKKMEMRYRHSIVSEKSWVVLRAEFLLEKGDVSRSEEKIREILTCRVSSQPKNVKCAGCVFKNFEFDSEEDIAKLRKVVGEIPLGFLEKKVISAGWLIEKAGLKGFSVGGARVSDVHGNFITSDGTASADQIAQVISVVKTTVRDLFGVSLKEELHYI